MSDKITQLFINGAKNILQDYLTSDIPKDESSVYTQGILIYKDGNDDDVFNSENEELWVKAFWSEISPFDGMVTGLQSYDFSRPHHITNVERDAKQYKVHCVLPPKKGAKQYQTVPRSSIKKGNVIYRKETSYWDGRSTTSDNYYKVLRVNPESLSVVQCGPNGELDEPPSPKVILKIRSNSEVTLVKYNAYLSKVEQTIFDKKLSLT